MGKSVSGRKTFGKRFGREADRRIGRAVLGGVALIALTTVPAADSGAVSLEEAVRAAIQTNPDMGIVVENRRATEYELEQAKGDYLPSLDFRGAAGYQTTNDEVSRSGPGDPWDNGPRYESSLTLKQMLFDGNATDSAVALRESRVISSARRVRDTSVQIAADAIQAYLEAIRQRKLTELAEENVRLHELTLDMVAKKAAGGAATIADVQEAESRLATAQATLEDSRARLRDADATYFRVMGEQPEDLRRPTPPSWALPDGLEVAIETALRNNPGIAVAKADLEAAVNEYRGTESSFYPTLDLELTASANRGVDGERGHEYDGTAMVVMRYNLFNGFKDQNRRKEFIARVGESRQRYNREVRLTEEEMRLAWNAWESAGRQIEALAREVQANDAVRKTYRKQFDLGARSLIELLDAENDLFLSKGQLISKQYLEIFAVYRILAGSGTLLSALDVLHLEQAHTGLDPVTPMAVDPADREGAAGPTLTDEELEELAPLVSPELEQQEPPAPTLEPEALDPEAPVLEPAPELLEPEPEVLDPDQDASLPASRVFAIGETVPYGFFDTPGDTGEVSGEDDSP